MKALVVFGMSVVAGATLFSSTKVRDVEPLVASNMALSSARVSSEDQKRLPEQHNPVEKASRTEAEKNDLISALSVQKPGGDQRWWERRATTDDSPKQMVVAAKTVELKRLDTIRKKLVQTAQKPAPQTKKDIAWGKSPKVSAVVAGGAQQFKPVTAPGAKTSGNNRKVALLNSKERRDLGRLVEEKKLPAIDLVIEFDYKSARLSDRALPLLARVGAALSDGKLADATFVIAGHTDSVGGNRYNMNLSSRRAASVRNYLRNVHHIDEKRLVAVGYGEERLKNTRDPLAAENRRVEFINLIR